jgi:hypothetical protein
MACASTASNCAFVRCMVRKNYRCAKPLRAAAQLCDNLSNQARGRGLMVAE